MNPIASLDDPIVDLLRSAPVEDATEAIRAAWTDYLPQHAATLTSRIMSLPAEVWERDPVLLIALARCQRAAPASNSFAALAYLDAASRLLASDPGPDSRLIVQVGVCRARALRGLGRVADARRELAVARAALAPLGLHNRLHAEALVLIGEGACLAEVGELDSAAQRLRHGLALLHDQSTEPAAVEALGWLAFVEYFTAEYSAPAVTIRRARELAPPEPIVELAPSLIVEAMAAIDECRSDEAAVAIEYLERVSAGTEYAAFARYLRCILEAEDSGPLVQLDHLQAIQLAVYEWQSPIALRSLHDMERSRVLIELDAIGAAREVAADLARRNALHGRHAQCPAQERARLALYVGDFDGVLDATTICRTLGDRHAPRSLAHVDVLRAAAHAGLGDALTAASAMDRALLQAARTGWRRHFLGLPAARLESMLCSAESRPQPTAALAVIAELRARRGPIAQEHAPALSARERIVLGCLVAGESRQQMSSRLSVSPNTIKAQVRSIYRKLGASNRHEAIDRATKYGLTV